jgi:hypothetical protein
MFELSFYIWGIVNLFAGIWEIYVFNNRYKLKIEKKTLWQKIYDNEITLSNFWIEGWNEYCKVDTRYIYRQYVWTFELINAVLAPIFLFYIVTSTYNKNNKIIKYILIISIINCLLYFATLIIDTYYCYNISNVAELWMYYIYYLISGIWLIVPLYLFSLL